MVSSCLRIRVPSTSIRQVRSDGPLHTAKRLRVMPAASASVRRSRVSDVKTKSPSEARAITAASMASLPPVCARSIPARLPSSSSRGATATLFSSLASCAWRPCPPRQTWAMTPPCVSGILPEARSRFTIATIVRPPRSTARNAPASRTTFTCHHSQTSRTGTPGSSQRRAVRFPPLAISHSAQSVSLALGPVATRRPSLLR